MGKRRQGRASGEASGEVAEHAAKDPRERSGSLTRELARIEELNLVFFEAFHRMDIDGIASLWSRSPYARCVHPGWEPVVGWPDIRQSWLEIFQSMKSIDFELEDVHVEVAGQTAWVNLVAHADVTTEDEDSFHTAVVASTIFEKVKDHWLIVLHHSSHFVEDEEYEGEEMEMDGHGFGSSNDSGGKPN
jgi:ketosteroid isomerase-like protein